MRTTGRLACCKSGSYKKNPLKGKKRISTDGTYEVECSFSIATINARLFMKTSPVRHFAALDAWAPDELISILDDADRIKASPSDYARAAVGKVLFMLFEKPSLRTRVSFETGMARLGGHAINYDTSSSPLGNGKETLEDTIRVVSRYADLIVARLFKHRDLETMIAYSSVPVINGLTDFSHPCQIMADLQTIREKLGRLRGVHVAYFGDANNNVTHSLMFGGAMLGMKVSVACPASSEFAPSEQVLAHAHSLAGKYGGCIDVVHDSSAADGADVVYTDSWMSYHIAREEQDRRSSILRPYQVDAGVMGRAASHAIFMNCLPAMRGAEQTAEVIDGAQSVVFDQAENRLWAQNAVMLRLLNEAK